MNITLDQRLKRYNISSVSSHDNASVLLNIINPNKIIGKTYAYVRVSTLKQAIEGESLQSQRDYIIKFCNDNNIPVPDPDDGWYADEGISGKKMNNRPKLQEMISKVKARDTIVTYSLSRLGRNTKEMLNFIDDMKSKNVKICPIKEWDWFKNEQTSSIFTTLFALFNEFEREQACTRTRDVLQNMSCNGTLRTKPRFGYKYVKDNTTGLTTIVEDEDKQKIIDYIAILIHKDPRITNSEIARRINIGIQDGTFIYNNKDGTPKQMYQNVVKSIIEYGNLRNTSVPTATGKLLEDQLKQ